MKVYFDVGANNGDTMAHHANDPDSIVYAFEPTPYLARRLEGLAERYAGRYVVVEKAVSEAPGVARFRVDGQADWGCSSLCEFNDNLKETWPGRNDFAVTDEIEVEVIALGDFVAEKGIESIEYLHVDAQGKDLEVLMGLRDKISIVKAGCIEMPTRHETKLYKDQKYVAADAVDFLKERGFEITSESSNDVYNNEVNIYFARATSI